MGELIEHLLEYSRLGRSDVRTQPVPLESMLSQLKQTFADRITEVGAVFEVESSAPVLIADPVLLHQILLNLIDNALTYRCPDRTPQVTISAVSEGDTVTVAVTDNGIGIPPEVQAKMFEVFARGHTNAEYPGTGIGLATVRKAARRMGSDVTVDSTVGVGTRFSLRLPIAQNGARHGG